jgi:putative hemolysin
LIEILIIFLLILGNGVLAMAEIAIVSARKVRLQQRAEAGDEGSRTALELANAPSRFLYTVQVGITQVLPAPSAAQPLQRGWLPGWTGLQSYSRTAKH